MELGESERKTGLPNNTDRSKFKPHFLSFEQHVKWSCFKIHLHSLSYAEHFKQTEWWLYCCRVEININNNNCRRKNPRNYIRFLDG